MSTCPLPAAYLRTLPLSHGQLCSRAHCSVAWCPLLAAPTQRCEYAAWGGHLEVLKWAREHGCPWDEEECGAAAAGGHQAMMRRSFWTGQRPAADGGHLQVLKWIDG